MTKEEFAKKIIKKAIGFQVGGFRPSDSILSSWFGKVLVARADETWPEHEGRPLIPICQLNLQELEDAPENAQDLAFLTLFVNDQDLPDDEPNGEGWLIRTYTSLDELTEIEQPELNSPIKPFQLKPFTINEDFPCWEDVTFEVTEDIEDNYYDYYENVDGIKLGGWPTLVQSEIYWAPWNKHPAEPEFVFQIDSVEKANWSWGDQGVAYIGRGTKEGMKDEWTFSWQCM